MDTIREIAMNSDQRIPPQAKSQSVKKAYEYFDDIKSEFKKISWTEGGEVLTYAKAVVLSTFSFGILIYITDLLINRVLFSFDTIFKWLVG